jgi:hypothetical protein
MRDDKRLIEDYLPIVAISAEASLETIRVGSVLNEDREPYFPCRRGAWRGDGCVAERLAVG